MKIHTRPGTNTSQRSHLGRNTLGALALLFSAASLPAQQSPDLPDAPSALRPSLNLVAAAADTQPALSSSSLDPTADPGSSPQTQTQTQTPTNPINPIGANGRTSEAAKAQHIAPRHWKYIPAGWTAQPLTPGLKAITGLQDLYSVSNFGAMFISAGYSHLTNAQPNYGTDRGAFGERLGAAAIRETTQGVFTDIVFASLLREDPRYYQLGPKFTPVHRTLYAITRPLVTRKDNGSSSVNGALLLGYAASAALNTAYYPASNRNVHDTFASWGGSVGGAALGFFVSEFTSDVLQALHLQKAP